MMLERFKNYLISRGIPIDSETEMIISFQYKSLHYLFEYDVNDKMFFRIIVPDIDPDTNNNEEKLKRMLEITGIYKVGKCFLVEEQVWLSAEMFSLCSENMEPIFQRVMDLLYQMFNEYRSDGTEQNS